MSDYKNVLDIDAIFEKAAAMESTSGQRKSVVAPIFLELVRKEAEHNIDLNNRAMAVAIRETAAARGATVQTTHKGVATYRTRLKAQILAIQAEVASEKAAQVEEEDDVEELDVSELEE